MNAAIQTAIDALTAEERRLEVAHRAAYRAWDALPAAATSDANYDEVQAVNMAAYAEFQAIGVARAHVRDAITNMRRAAGEAA